MEPNYNNNIDRLSLSSFPNKDIEWVPMKSYIVHSLKEFVVFVVEYIEPLTVLKLNQYIPVFSIYSNTLTQDASPSRAIQEHADSIIYSLNIQNYTFFVLYNKPTFLFYTQTNTLLALT